MVNVRADRNNRHDRTWNQCWRGERKRKPAVRSNEVSQIGPALRCDPLIARQEQHRKECRKCILFSCPVKHHENLNISLFERPSSSIRSRWRRAGLSIYPCLRGLSAAIVTVLKRKACEGTSARIAPSSTAPPTNTAAPKWASSLAPALTPRNSAIASTIGAIVCLLPTARTQPTPASHACGTVMGFRGLQNTPQASVAKASAAASA